MELKLLAVGDVVADSGLNYLKQRLRGRNGSIRSTFASSTAKMPPFWA